MKSIGYWQPEDALPLRGICSSTFWSIPAAKKAEKNWAAFQADPEWKKVKADSEINGPLVDRIDRWFMDPTGFRP